MAKGSYIGGSTIIGAKDVDWFSKRKTPAERVAEAKERLHEEWRQQVRAELGEIEFNVAQASERAEVEKGRRQYLTSPDGMAERAEMRRQRLERRDANRENRADSLVRNKYRSLAASVHALFGDESDR